MEDQKLQDQKELLSTLAKLSGRTVNDDAVDYRGSVFTVPVNLKGSSSRRIARTLEDIIDAQEEFTEITRTFPYHPYDVAAAVARVLDRYFGLRAVGRSWTGVQVNANGDTVEVPYGESIQIPQLGSGYITSRYQPDFANNGKPIGFVEINLPRNLTAQAHGVFEAITAELKINSIFRGKAIDANWTAPSFTDPFAVDRSKIVYTRSTEVQLSANLWSVLRHREKLADLGMSGHRAVLLAGPYGTGKSLGALVTAQEALSNGWTFIQVKPEQDLSDGFMAAKLYAPAVLFVEDIDTRASSDLGGDQLSKILDMFDGIDRKASGDIVVVPTTNHLDRIHKGVLRPGRLDAVVKVERLDEEAILRLVKVTSPIPVVGDLDAVVESMRDYTPAFIVEAVGRAVRYAIARSDGHLPDQFTSDDLVQAAEGLRPQYDLMIGEVAKDDRSLDAAMRRTVEDSVNGRVKELIEELV